MTFGPWAVAVDPAERLARLRSLRALALLLARPHARFIRALALAETDPASLPEALALLDRLPALTRRRLLASYAALGSGVELARYG
jgi:hypothetical protein